MNDWKAKESLNILVTDDIAGVRTTEAAETEAEKSYKKAIHYAPQFVKARDMMASIKLKDLKVYADNIDTS